MHQLAKDKCEIYNKNKIDSKIESLETSNLGVAFNPASAPQKQQFFDYCGIESENQTKAGNDQWNRPELEKLQKLLKMMIETEENKNE